jgi:hypothetical protein
MDGRQDSGRRLDVYGDASKHHEQSKDGGMIDRAPSTNGFLGLSRMGSRCNEPVVLCVSDLRYIVASSIDVRRDIRAIFGNDDRDRDRDRDRDSVPTQSLVRMNSTGLRVTVSRSQTQIPRGWMSTGLMPQFVTMRFKDRWLVEKVR